MHCCELCSQYAKKHNTPPLFACIATDHETCFRCVLVTQYKETPKHVVSELRTNEWSLIHACVFYGRPNLAKLLLTINDDLRNLRIAFGNHALTPFEMANKMESMLEPGNLETLQRVKDILLQRFFE